MEDRDWLSSWTASPLQSLKPAQRTFLFVWISTLSKRKERCNVFQFKISFFPSSNSVCKNFLSVHMSISLILEYIVVDDSFIYSYRNGSSTKSLGEWIYSKARPVLDNLFLTILHDWLYASFPLQNQVNLTLGWTSISRPHFHMTQTWLNTRGEKYITN